jgi:quinol monooxygenase YgiN
MRKWMPRLAVAMLLATASSAVVRLAGAADQPLTVVVRFYPVPGREDELQARLAKLRDFVHKNNPGVSYKLHRSLQEPVVFLLYETFPTEAAFDNQAKHVFPAFQLENGAVPAGIVTRPVEQEMFRALTD